MPGVLLAIFLQSCDGSSPTAPPDNTPPQWSTLSSQRFDLRYTAETEQVAARYATALEASYPRLATDLGTAGLPRVEGWLHPTQASFTAATGYQASGSVDGPVRFHVVALPFTPEIAVHELAHNVTLQIAPFASDNPVWLWEAIALYEADQLVHPSLVPQLVAGDFPTLAELDNRNFDPSIYDVGYTLAEYVVEGWGPGALRQLILAYGDLRVLGTTEEALQAGWREFVEERYLGG